MFARVSAPSGSEGTFLFLASFIASKRALKSISDTSTVFAFLA